MRRITFSAVFLLAMLASACSWVQLEEGAEKVRVLTPQEVVNCRHLGRTTVSVKHTVAGVPRKESVMQAELEKLARNSALKLGGDTVVPVTGIANGERTYKVYKCVGVNVKQRD